MLSRPVLYGVLLIHDSQLRFVLSSQQRIDDNNSHPKFYSHLLKFLKDSDREDFAEDLLCWWNE